ncbi:MAG: ABC transporter substrate-binding protein [Proteobacteria bacterium]|nr:ABC transporter substrate-binding protein [Pseudomonadota bacterium]MBI3498146.1 ABC transporter substrate-binding protein [Pseudomonadota bacterium]
MIDILKRCVPALVGSLLAAMPAMAETTLKFIPQADLRVLDTAWTTAAITRNHGYLIYEPLFSYDSKVVARPQAVESWTASPDGLTWRFTLRPLRFDDGSPVTSADAVASLERWSQRKASGQAMRVRLEAIKAVDDRSFELRFRERFGLVLETLADAIQPTFVLRAKDAASDPFTQIQFQDVVGSGPFRFVKDEWVPGSKVVYRKSAGYSPRAEPPDGFFGAKQVKLDQVEWIYIPDANTAVQALIRGEADVMEIPPAELIPILKRTPGIVVAVQDPFGSQAFFRLNSLHPPMDKAKFRQALALLVDQNEMLAGYIGNKEYEVPCLAIFGCGGPNETDAGAAAFRKADLERAKGLIKESGYAGEPVVILDPTDQHILHEMAGLMAGAMRAAGIAIDLQANDWGAVIARGSRPDKPGPGSPGWHMQPTWAPARVIASPLTSTQLIHPCDPKIFNGNPCDQPMETLRQAFFAASAETRRPVVDRIQSRFYEVMPFVLVGQFLAPKAWRANVTGIVNASEFVFWGVEKK